MQLYGQMLELTSSQLIFIIVIPVIVLIVGLIFLFVFLSKRHYKKTFKEHYYKTINNIVMYNDFLLINEFPLSKKNGNKLLIDHIICGNKYIYVVLDYFYNGDIKGNASDESLVLYRKGDKKEYVDNPLKISEKVIYKLSVITGIDISALKGIVLVNDSCILHVKNPSKMFTIINKKEIKKYIKEQEKDPSVGNFNEDQLQNAAKVLKEIKSRN